ncbi:maleylpyruvate isomerase N-terminal domain-containing protein [Streptomyces sp. NEAU-Y11]|uniref:maleylpyruvate isomerase N-terminal domain-containing protein n=1 Tax=Streptomyces cucumeris TaxID=2962890 RepID=UPI0035AB7027
MSGAGGPEPHGEDAFGDDAFGNRPGAGRNGGGRPRDRSDEGHADDPGGGRGGPGRGDETGIPPEPFGPPRIPPPRAAAEDCGHWPGALDAGIPAPRRPGRDPMAPPSTVAGPGPGPGPGTAPEPEAEPEPEPEAAAEPGPTAGSTAGSAPMPRPPSHDLLRSLLGAWALTACSQEETAAVEDHLNDCNSCAEEALRLREAVGLLHSEHSLDLDPLLRSRVLAGCLGRRPARIPVPSWAAAYDAEAARLDALLRDMGEAEWRAPVRLKWFDGERLTGRDTTVEGVIGHLMVVDGLIAASLGLPDPLGTTAPGSPSERTEAYWRTGPAPASGTEPRPNIRELWREQGHTLVRTVSFAGRGVSDLDVPYGDFALPLRDAFLDRAFECWVHAGDIAEAVDYPYEPPASAHLKAMIDLCARLLPGTLAERRRAGLAAPPRRLVAAGSPGRTLHLEVEGVGGGDWYIPLDSPAALASPEEEVAHIALDGEAFYQLAAGHVPPAEAAAGQSGDIEAIRDVLYATASLSRL